MLLRVRVLRIGFCFPDFRVLLFPGRLCSVAAMGSKTSRAAASTSLYDRFVHLSAAC